MSRKRYRFFLVALASVCISGLPGCGHDQKLESITVQPSGFVFEGIGAKGQFTAIGTYIHPPESKDITNHVLWQIDVANLATITQSGSVSALSVCGSGNVTATVYSNPQNPAAGSVVIGSATVKGVLDGTPTCQ